MIAPVGVEWLLLSPWSPFYWFWETRWLVFKMVSIPTMYGINPNPIIGWTLFAAGSSIFLAAFTQFLIKRQRGIISTGLYAKVRHPQYLGIIIATLGYTMASERPMAWMAWLNLTFLYLLLASTEENILQKTHLKEIQTYKEQVPFIVPFLPHRLSRLPTTKSRLKWLTLALIYFLMIVAAWIVLERFSYAPSHFW
jgi:protein-S-isoprenylcysteine O-methyltransferase Ste14